MFLDGDAFDVERIELAESSKTDQAYGAIAENHLKF